jgi:hypothetical protein
VLDQLTFRESAARDHAAAAVGKGTDLERHARMVGRASSRFQPRQRNGGSETAERDCRARR